MAGLRVGAALFVSWTCILVLSAARLPAEEIVFTSIELSGKFTRGQIGRLEMNTGERNWLVVLDSREHLELLKKKQTTMRFKGQGKASVLASKMYVRLTANVDPKTLKATEPIREITWFTPVHETRYGAIPVDVGLRPDIRDGERREGEAPPRREGEAAVGDEPRDFYIVGWIKKLQRNGQMTIEFNEAGGRIEAELAADAVVDIDIDNKDVVYQLIRPGDQMDVKGIYREAGRVFAGEVVIHREEVMGEELANTERPALPRVDGGAAVAPVTPVSGEADVIPPGGAFAPPQPQPAGGEPRVRILKIN